MLRDCNVCGNTYQGTETSTTCTPCFQTLQIAALRAKLEQANATIREWGNAYAELNVRLAGVEAERDMFRVALANEQGYSKREAKAVAAGDKALLDRAEQAEARVRELEHFDKLYNDVCVALPMEASSEDEAADVVRRIVEQRGELRADRDRLQRVVDGMREELEPYVNSPVIKHSPNSFGAGYHTACCDFNAKLDALLREGK